MNWRRFFVVMFALLMVLSIGATQLVAQTQSTGDIAGVVTDPSGAVVPDAKILLKDNTKGNTQDAVTDRNGSYRFYLLPPGSYSITVTVQNFQSQTRTADVAVGQIANLNFQLSVGASSSTVTVTEAAPLMSSDNGNVATTLTQEQVSQVPNPGNDMSYVAQLAPGSVMNTGMGFGNFSSYGMPGTSNLFTLDGMDDNDPYLNLNNSGATNLLLGANEVQEATVVNGAYTGEYGTLAGANVNYVTKSGGNEFHGNAVYYWNGSALNANGWFNNAAGVGKSFDNANQWAASFGGPIKHDKLFFFANTEGLRVIIPTSVQVKIPSPQFEDFVANPTTGVLATSGLSASIPFFNNAFALYNAAPGAGAAANTLTAGGCATGFSLPGGAPCALAFQSTIPNFTHEYTISGRVDYNIGTNDRLFLRVGYDHGLQATATSVISPLFNLQSDQPQWQGQLNETHTFSPTLANQFILSGAWYSAIFTEANRAGALAAFPTTLSWRDGTFSSMGPNLDNAPQGRKVTQYQISDDLSKTLGNQTLKVGVKFRRNDVSDFSYGVLTAGLDGVTQASVAGADPGQALFLEQSFPSNPNNPTAPGALSQPMALYSLAGYGEDDWRVRSNLTLTFALRAEHFSNPVCQSDCFAGLSSQFNQINHDPTVPYNQVISTGQNRALLNLDKINWAPRFGFAWQPLGVERNLVVRGGAGIFYDQFPGQVVDNFSQNPPLYNIFVIGGHASPQETMVDASGGPNAFANALASNTGLVTGFNQGATLADLSAIPGFSPPGIFTADAKTRVPQYMKWSLEVQKGFGANTSVTIGYYGNHGIHELVVDPSVNAFCDPSVSAAAGGVCPGFVGLPLNPTDQRFSTVSWADSAAVSNYNGVTATFTHRFSGWSKGVVSVNYTYSHAFDETSNGGLLPFVDNTNVSPLSPQIPGNYRNNYGPADYDVRNYFNANYVWELPIRKLMGGHGWAPLVDGWQISGAIFARGGLPYTAVDGAFSGGLAGNNYGATIYPQFLGGSVPSCGQSAAILGAGLSTTAAGCLSAAQFPVAGSETAFGSNGLRNKFRGPGYTDLDFTVQKATTIPHWERGRLGIAAQFFNVLNHPNFDQPINDISSPAFGQIVSTISTPTSILGAFLGGNASPRIIQLKASLTF
jgi:Carboxypeptidase regulatory-like domain